MPYDKMNKIYVVLLYMVDPWPQELAKTNILKQCK